MNHGDTGKGNHILEWRNPGTLAPQVPLLPSPYRSVVVNHD